MRARTDDGFATVWAAGIVAVLLGVLVIGIELGAAVTGRHRAESAADLAALAAAGHAVLGEESACARAAGLAAQTGVRISTCRLDGWDALVEAEVELDLAVVGPTVATGRARAGPALPTDPSDTASGPRNAVSDQQAGEAVDG